MEENKPTTEAGRRLNNGLRAMFDVPDALREILAIEAEARAEGEASMFNELGAKGIALAAGPPALSDDVLAEAYHATRSEGHRKRNPMMGMGEDVCDIDVRELAFEYRARLAREGSDDWDPREPERYR